MSTRMLLAILATAFVSACPDNPGSSSANDVGLEAGAPDGGGEIDGVTSDGESELDGEVAVDVGGEADAAPPTGPEFCTATFQWLQKDAYKDTAGRNSILWPPHTTTTLRVVCEPEDGLGEAQVVADTFMANHGTEPGTLDDNGDVILEVTRSDSVTGSDRAAMLELVAAYEACECYPATDFLSMDALQDEAVQLVVGKLVEFVSDYLDCNDNPPIADIVAWLQVGDIAAIVDALPNCEWDVGWSFGIGFTLAAAEVLDDATDTLDTYHVCNNDAQLQAELWDTFASTGTSVACDAGTAAVCSGPAWFYDPND